MSAAYCRNTGKSAANNKNGSGTTEFWYNCDWDGAIDLMPTDVAKFGYLTSNGFVKPPN